MISIAQAISTVKANTNALMKTTIKTVEKAGGYILSKDIKSPINMPPFNQSAMDGYALSLHESNTYRLMGEIQAGDEHQPILKPGEATEFSQVQLCQKLRMQWLCKKKLLLKNY